MKKPTSDEEIRAFVNSARTGNLSAVEQFINAGISLDKGYGEDRRTALMEAAAAGESNVVLQLLLAGAKPEISDYWGHRALNYALRAGNGEIAKMLIVAGAPLPSADNTGWTVLHIAAEYGESEIIRFLIDLGNVNNRYKYLLDVQAYGKRTPLIPATRAGRIDIVDMLLAAGADPNGKGSWPLFHAIRWQRTAILERLLAYGADPNWQDSNDGQTALHVAAEFGYTNYVKQLLEAGANPAVVDLKGKTATQIAREHGFYYVAQLIDQATQ